MDKETFLAAVRSVNMASDEQLETMLDEPVRDTDFDSLDFELLRTSLEKRMGKEIPEQIWESAATLRQLMDAL